MFERFPPEAAARYNRSFFTFTHTLHALPIFDVENIVELSKRIADAHYENAPTHVGAGWSKARAGRPSLHETLATIGESNSLVLMKGVARDPEFAPVFRDIVLGLYDLVGGALSDDVAESRATIIVGSPRQITPYHIDAETNFLFQVRGTKLIHVFDTSNGAVLPHAELERFYAGNFNAATYKPDHQPAAAVVTFGPGDGIHIPIHTPHWVQNGASVSVAISVNFTLDSNRRVAQVYRLNHLLRKSGLSPSPPGGVRWRDRLKVAAAGGLDFARRVRRLRTGMNDPQ
jgi:hypothetical protein